MGTYTKEQNLIRISFLTILLSCWLSNAELIALFVANPNVKLLKVGKGTKVIWRCLQKDNGYNKQKLAEFLIEMQTDLNLLIPYLLEDWTEKRNIAKDMYDALYLKSAVLYDRIINYNYSSIFHKKDDCVKYQSYQKELAALTLKYNRYDALLQSNYVQITKIYRDGNNLVLSRIEKYCEHIGITPKRMHCIRRTYISTLFDNNIHINTIMKQAGHADKQTTLNNYVYDRCTEEEKDINLENALRD